MSALFYLPRQFVIDGSGDPRAGAQLFFYEAGTLTLQDTYSDSALTTANANPVVADASGTFGAIFLSNNTYRVILRDSSSVQIWDQDNVNAAVAGLFGSSFSVQNGNYTAVVADKGNLIEFTATATLTLPAVADAGEGFTLAVWNSSTGVVTIDPNASEQINGANSIILYENGWAFLTTDGSAWRAVHKEGVQQGAFSATLTGFSSNPTPTISYVRDDKTVSLYLNAGSSGTSNADSMTMTGVPAQLRPTTSVNEFVRVTDNGIGQMGVATVASTGVITFGLFGNVGATYSTAAFTASGTKGLPGSWGLRYTLN